MRLSHELTIKRTSTVTAGELILLNLEGHRAVALVIAADQGAVAVAVLRSDENLGPPFFIDLESHGDCISYGADWVLELIAGPETRPRNTPSRNAPGAISLSKEGPLLFLPPHETQRSQHSDLAFNLASNKIAEFDNRWPPYFRWRAWASDVERLSSRCEPIVEIHAAARS